MDFAICPSCKQSVLDDDAENCPFCGASMKAPAGAQARSAGQPVSAVAPTKTAAKAPPKPKEDELPFDTEVNLPPTEFKVSPTAAKGRTLKVTCPMCDTVGYVPASAAGKHVRCLNPGCHMPVFLVPAPEPEPPPPPPAKPKGKPLLWGIITTVVVGGVGFVVWWFASKPDLETVVKPLTPEEIQRIKDEEALRSRLKTVDKSLGQGTETASTATPKTQGTPPPPGPSPEEMIKQTLRLMEQAALQTGNQNRSKPYCRRLAAESAVLAGEPAVAREHLEQLQKVGPDLPFYRIGALTELFWYEQSAGNSAAALTALDEALTAAQNLPSHGRDHLDLATRLAVALVVAGRTSAAREVIQAHQSSGIEGEISAFLQTLAGDLDLISPSRQVELRPIVMRQTPQAAAVTVLLILRGQPAAALEWAKGWSLPETKAECLTALTEVAVLGRLNELPLAEIETLPPQNQLLLWARTARRQATRGLTDAARDSLKRAHALLEKVQVPEEFVLPDTPTLMKWKPATYTDLVALAAGCAELAVVQQLLEEDAAAVSRSLTTAVQVCRAIGPTLGPVQKMQLEADRLGLTGLRQKLKAELELKTDDLARQMLGPYRKALNDLELAAQERFRLQTTILSRTAQVGLEDQVWTIVSSRATDSDPLRHEPYLKTEVAGWLVDRFRARGAQDVAQAVIAAASEAGVAQIRRPVESEFEEHLAASRFKEALAVLQRPEAKEWREPLVLLAVVRLAAQAPLEKVWQLIGMVGDGVLREQAWELAGAIATRRGQGIAVFQQLSSLSASTEKIALGKGLISGLKAAKSQ